MPFSYSFNNLIKAVMRPFDPDKTFFVICAGAIVRESAVGASRGAAFFIGEKQIDAVEPGIPVEKSSFKAECHGCCKAHS